MRRPPAGLLSGHCADSEMLHHPHPGGTTGQSRQTGAGRDGGNYRLLCLHRGRGGPWGVQSAFFPHCGDEGRLSRTGAFPFRQGGLCQLPGGEPAAPGYPGRPDPHGKRGGKPGGAGDCGRRGHGPPAEAGADRCRPPFGPVPPGNQAHRAAGVAPRQAPHPGHCPGGRLIAGYRMQAGGGESGASGRAESPCLLSGGGRRL